MKFFPSKKTLVQLGWYFSLGTVVFVIGMIWNFPYERLKERLTKTLTKSTGYQFDMEELSPVLPLGFVAKNARIIGSGFASRPLNIEFDSLKIKANPFTLILCAIQKNVCASYDIQRKQARWIGDFSYGPNQTSVNVNTKNLKIKETLSMEDFNPLFYGSDLKVESMLILSTTLTGETGLLQRGDLSTSNGNLTFTANNTVIDAPVVKRLDFDKITIEALLEKGTLNIKSIALSGPTITGKANGFLKLDPYIQRSQLTMDVKMTINEKAGSIRTLVQTYAPSQGIRMDENGTIAMKVSGPLNRLSVRGY